MLTALRPDPKAPDEGLIADWTFDERTDGAYANVAGQGLAAKVMGTVDHVEGKDGKYVRLARKGWLEVAPDERLDASAALTLDAWVRPIQPGILVTRQVVWQWGMIVRVDLNSVMVTPSARPAAHCRLRLSFLKKAGRTSWWRLVPAARGKCTRTASSSASGRPCRRR